MGKYVIYARKSTESEDRQVLSIDSQVREVRQLADRHGVPVADVLTESRSAKAPGRPVFGQLIRRIQRGEVSGVLCWKMDRLARNPYDSGVILQAQADGKLERIITSDGIKTADGNDRLMGTFELAFATKFIDDLRANVKRGNRARFEKGWPNHLPPIGYLNDPSTKTIVKDAERFELVRRMWDALLQGDRPKHIAQVASREWGLLTVRRGRIGGNPITYSSIYKLFTNPYYAGFIRLKDGRRYLGAHEPMITAEEFDRAQKLLGTRGRARYAKHDNPYAGLIRCAHCGCSVVAEYHEKRGRPYTYYRCCRSKPGVRCREKPISDRKLASQLTAYFRRLAIPQPLLEFLHARLDRHDASQAGSAAGVREHRERALRTLEREQKELLTMRLRQLVSDEEFQLEREALNRRHQDLERAASVDAAADAGQDARKAEVVTMLDLVHGAPLALEQGDPVQLRSILQRLQLEITLQGRRLDVSVSEPLSHLVKAGSVSNWCATWSEIWKWIQEGDVTEDSLTRDREHA
jgi:DNA invertase Pin-like site-specific DNA recombinase